MNNSLFSGDTLLINGTGRTDFQNGNSKDAYNSIFNKLLTKLFFISLILFFWNSFVPTSEIISSDRNFKAFGFGVFSIWIITEFYRSIRKKS